MATLQSPSSGSHGRDPMDGLMSPVARTLSVARLESASGTLFNVLRPADPASSQQHQQGGRPPSSVVQPTSPGFEPASRTPSRARARHRPRGRHSRRVNVDHSPISGTPSPSRGGGHASPRGVGVAKPSGGAGSGAGAGGGSAASSPRAPMRQLGSSPSTTSGSVRRAASQPAQPPRSPIHLHPESPPRRSTSHRPVLPLLHGFEHEGDGSRGSSPQSAASCRSAAARSSSAPAHRRSTGSRLARPTTAPAQSASQRKLQELRERMMRELHRTQERLQASISSERRKNDLLGLPPAPETARFRSPRDAAASRSVMLAPGHIRPGSRHR